MNIAPSLKATTGLMMTYAIEFASGFSARTPYLARQLSMFRPSNLPRRVPELVFWLVGLVEIRNSKVNVDIQFR